MRQISNEVNALLKGIIERREKAMKVGKIANDDLLGLLMEFNYKEMQEHDERKNDIPTQKRAITSCSPGFAVNIYSGMEVSIKYHNQNFTHIVAC